MDQNKIATSSVTIDHSSFVCHFHRFCGMQVWLISGPQLLHVIMLINEPSMVQTQRKLALNVASVKATTTAQSARNIPPVKQDH